MDYESKKVTQILKKVIISSTTGYRQFLPVTPIPLQKGLLFSKSEELFYYFSYRYYSLGNRDNHPAFINAAKNDMSKSVFTYKVPKPIPVLDALRCVYECFIYSLPKIAEAEGMRAPIAVCMVPRAKREEHYHSDQLGIKLMLQMAIADCQIRHHALGFEDATDAIKRVKNTGTTHGAHGVFIGNPLIEIPVDSRGDFMRNSCEVDDSLLVGRDVILVDDIYTPGNPIDIAALGMVASSLLKNPETDSKLALYTLGVTINSQFVSRGIEEIK